MQETFKVITDEPTYMISNLGRVQSIRSGKIVKGSIAKRGYWVADFRREYKNDAGKKVKRGRVRTIHQLVGIHFIDNPNNYSEIDHIDRNKLNNCVDNLRWTSSFEQKLNISKYTKRQYTSKYKGVSFNKQCKLNPWKAAVSVKNKHICLGSFSTENEAALAYNKYYIENNLAEFAYLNNIVEE